MTRETTMTSETVPATNPMRGKSLDEFLEYLPLFAGVVSGGERMKGATDAELQAWAYGIEDTVEHVRRLIREWKEATNDGQ